MIIWTGDVRSVSPPHSLCWSPTNVKTRRWRTHDDDAVAANVGRLTASAEPLSPIKMVIDLLLNSALASARL